MLYEGGVRVPGFISGGHPALPDSVRGTVNTKLVHLTDWLPTIVGLAGGSTTRNRPLDGHDVWAALTTDAPSPRTELLHNFNPACGEGYVNPDAGIRVGDWKLLVGCFNITTLTPNDGTKVELYNVTADPYETTDHSAEQPAIVKRLMARLAFYASSTDQVPPTLFWPFNGTGDMIRPWNYQVRGVMLLVKDSN